MASLKSLMEMSHTIGLRPKAWATPLEASLWGGRELLFHTLHVWLFNQQWVSLPVLSSHLYGFLYSTRTNTRDLLDVLLNSRGTESPC